jgi:hypothetical protein
MTVEIAALRHLAKEGEEQKRIGPDGGEPLRGGRFGASRAAATLRRRADERESNADDDGCRG